MTCGARHVFVIIATAVVLAGGAAVRAQQAPPAQPAQPTPAPSAQTPRPAQPSGQAPRSSPPSAQTPRPIQPSQPERAPSQNRDAFRAPQGFSVVLVVADLQAATAADDVPPAARRALTDMKEFLPYKSYRLVDAAWILGQSTGNTVTRLRGPEEQDYEVMLATSRGEGARVSVRFTLRDAGMSEHAVVSETASKTERNREVEKLEREIAQLQERLTEARRASQEQLSKEIKAQLDATERRKRSFSTMSYQDKYSPRAARTVIDTSFTMDVGETVVVGTSRLKANSKALIALLTAVPAKGTKITPTESR